MTQTTLPVFYLAMGFPATPPAWIPNFFNPDNLSTLTYTIFYTGTKLSLSIFNFASLNV